MTAVRVLGIQSDAYERHGLHDPEMPWQETNCYVDVWIELIHAFRFPVEPALGFTLNTDFEQDQWTFFKPAFQHLERLYGFRIEELALWRTLPEHCRTQVSNGSLPLLEVDSFYLPDTAATDYRQNHVKTTIGINEIDPDEGLLGYFHNAGYHTLDGADFDGLFRLNRSNPEDFLQPYCEVVKTGRLKSAEIDPRLVLDLLQEHLGSRPETNPFHRYQSVFDDHLQWVTDMASYHAYVFATLRQCGAAFDLASRHLLWLEQAKTASNDGVWRGAADEFSTISAGCKTMLLKLARVANGRSPRDLAAMLEPMGQAWEAGFEHIAEALAASR